MTAGFLVAAGFLVTVGFLVAAQGVTAGFLVTAQGVTVGFLVTDSTGGDSGLPGGSAGAAAQGWQWPLLPAHRSVLAGRRNAR